MTVNGPAELIPRKRIFYSICLGCRGGRIGDFGGGGKGVCNKKTPMKVF